MNVYALHITGKDAPMFRVFASARAASLSGNGFMIITNAESIAKSALTMAQITAAYNKFSGREVKGFHDKPTAAERLFTAMEKAAEGMTPEGEPDAPTTTATETEGETTVAATKKINREKAPKKTKKVKAEGSAPRASHNDGVIIRANDEVLKAKSADGFHRPGSEAHIALTAIIAYGKKGAPWRELVDGGISTKYISRNLRLTDLLVADEK